MTRGPDFIIIGAMKCATSTLHEQLAQQPGIFMTDPKEPYFFSDDPIYAKGLAWYESLFDGAAAGDLCGESSTHYTKLPTYPKAVERLANYKRDLKLIYIIRDPTDRLVSQYVHEWTERKVRDSINQAIETLPALVDYSLYATQLAPYLKTFGAGRILLISFEKLIAEPQVELERVCQFIGYAGQATWQHDHDAQNISAQRVRKSTLRDAIVYAPVISQIRDKLVPKSLRNKIKTLWQLQARPKLCQTTLTQLHAIFDRDLKTLGQWLGMQLTCDTFKSQTKNSPLQWAEKVEISYQSSQQSLPRCGAVVIGRNEGERLKSCFESLQNDVERIVYVDSGSTDDSVELARSKNIEVVELNPDEPFTAARARNAGLQRLVELDTNLAFVQFVDGDCSMAPGWIKFAAEHLTQHPHLAVVCGRRREQFPTASVYHRLIDMEWNTPVGLARACGGDSLMRITALQQVGTFSASMICGEEPELCLRLRQAGWRIERLAHEMTSHDAAITRFSQWWKRSIRSGWAFTEGAAMHGKSVERYNVQQSRSIVKWAVVLPLIALGFAWWTGGLSLMLLGIYPLQGLRIYHVRRCRGDQKQDARIYATFCVLGKWPQLVGWLRYKINCWRGGRVRLIEYKTTPFVRSEL